jgi:hypothetical protein
MRRVLVLAAGGVLTASLAGVAVADAMTYDGRTDPAAARLLAAAVEAGRSTDYVGTQVVMLWAGDRQRSATVQVAHRAGTGSLIEVEETATSRAQRTFEPDRVGSAATAGLSEQVLELVARNYVVSLEGVEEVIGRGADVVAVRRPDGTPVQRLWIDRDSRLVLRRKFFDSAGRLVRQTAFVSLRRERPTFTEPLPVAEVTLDGAVQLGDAAGARNGRWRLPDNAPAGMVALDSSVRGSEADAVLRVTYSDGLGTLSLFEQPGRLDASGLDGWVRDEIAGVPVWVSPGYPRRIVWSGGDRVYTVVAECHDPAVEHVVRSLPRGQASKGLGDRLGRGVRRVGSWVNPAR